MHLAEPPGRRSGSSGGAAHSHEEFKDQVALINHSYQVAWFTFEHRVRRVNYEILQPIVLQQERLRKLVSRDVFQKIDQIQRRQLEDAYEAEGTKEAVSQIAVMSQEMKHLQTKLANQEKGHGGAIS